MRVFGRTCALCLALALVLLAGDAGRAEPQLAPMPSECATSSPRSEEHTSELQSH